MRIEGGGNKDAAGLAFALRAVCPIDCFFCSISAAPPKILPRSWCVRRWPVFLTLLRHRPAVPRPWRCAQSLRRDHMADFLTKAIHSVANPLQRAVDFKKPVVLRSKFRPEPIAVSV